jgi:hypothetical protein
VDKIYAVLAFIGRQISVMGACIDLLYLEMNLKIAMALNWFTGRAAKDFFAPANWIGWAVYTLYSFMEATAENDSYAGSIFVAAIFYVFIWDSRQVKRWFDAGKYGPLDWFVRLHRVILPVIIIFQLCFLMVAWYDFIRYAAYFIITFGRYCYIYDIPPRDSVFSKIKSKIKNIKLPNIAPVPSPA